MEDKIQKIIELVNSRSSREQDLGIEMMAQITLSEAWTVCSASIKARGVHSVKFLFDRFDPQTYPVKRSKVVLHWEKLHAWVDANPNQKACLRKDRNYDLEVGKKYKVCKLKANEAGWSHVDHGQPLLIAQTGKFVKETACFYTFDTFKVSKDTLISIDPVK